MTISGGLSYFAFTELVFTRALNDSGSICLIFFAWLNWLLAFFRSQMFVQTGFGDFAVAVWAVHCGCCVKVMCVLFFRQLKLMLTKFAELASSP